MPSPFALPQIDRTGRNDDSTRALPRPYLTTSFYLFSRENSDTVATHQYTGNPYIYGRTVNELQPVGEENFSVIRLPIPDAAKAFQIRLVKGGEIWLSFLGGDKPLFPAVIDRSFPEAFAPGFLLPADTSSIYVGEYDRDFWYCMDASLITLTGLAFQSMVNIVWFSRLPA